MRDQEDKIDSGKVPDNDHTGQFHPFDLFCVVK